jgi:hypothetical protein
MTAAEFRRWMVGRAAAERREHDERAGRPLSAAESWRQATALIALSARRHGWPLPADDLDWAEDLQCYRTWARLRAAWRGPGDGD